MWGADRVWDLMVREMRIQIAVDCWCVVASNAVEEENPTTLLTDAAHSGCAPLLCVNLFRVEIVGVLSLGSIRHKFEALFFLTLMLFSRIPFFFFPSSLRLSLHTSPPCVCAFLVHRLDVRFVSPHLRSSFRSLAPLIAGATCFVHTPWKTRFGSKASETALHSSDRKGRQVWMMPATNGGFHGDTSEQEVEQLLASCNAKMECSAKPITHAFISSKTITKGTHTSDQRTC